MASWITLALPTSAAAREGSGPPNLLLILLDDVGIDQLEAYADENHWPTQGPGLYPYAQTPLIQRMADEGLRFTQARVNPVCSTTRATVQCGLYGFRTGLGNVIRIQDNSDEFEEFSLPPAPDVDLLPELPEFASWERAMFGKWHLGLPTTVGPFGWPLWSGDDHPNLVGWPHFVGAMQNLNQPPNPGPFDVDGDGVDEAPGYNHWYRVIDGARAATTVFATTRQRRDCQDWIRQQQLDPEQPHWMAVLSFNACHAPLDWPRADTPSWPDPTLAMWPDGTGDPWDHYRAMLEHVDQELTTLFATIGDPDEHNTLVLFMGDNGTPGEIFTAAEARGQAMGGYAPLVGQDRFKRSVYELGVRVPLIAWGACVGSPGESTEVLVDGVDVFATLRHAATLTSCNVLPPEPTSPAVDGVSFLSSLSDYASAGNRAFSFEERFRPNGDWTDTACSLRAYLTRHNGRLYKLVRRRVGSMDQHCDDGAPLVDEVYNLTADPLELNPLGNSGPIYDLLTQGLGAVLSS